MKSNPENIKLWIKALRSGRFKQGRGMLAPKDLFCCLGVACEVAIENDVTAKKTPLNGAFRYDKQLAHLPTSVRKWLGIARINPILNAGFSASILNDARGWDFNQIADAIEKTYLETA